MEGKAILFKAFADLDVFDLEVGSEHPDDLIRFCQLLEPTVGGINLEDIRSPDCFYVEERLRATLGIPVFHDDQHGTAIISGAALLNALELVRKPIDGVRIVFAGAGAAAIATAEHYVRLGVRREHIVLCEHRGVIHAARDDLDDYKRRFAAETSLRTLAEALKGADVFVGLSTGGIVSGEMVAAMAARPIIFALANPTPEIMPDEAMRARPDAIIATGRSDFPNQVNNVEEYRAELDARLGRAREVMRGLTTRAQQAPQRIVFPEGEDARIVRAARILADEGVAAPILLGDPALIRRHADDSGVTLEDLELANPRVAPDREALATELWERRRRKGITLREARVRVEDPMYYALLMLRAGRADAVVAGEDVDYRDPLRPALEVIGAGPGRRHVSGIYMLVFPQQTFFFADCTVNIEPDAETLAEIASATAQFVSRLGIEPRVAMLSFSNFGSVKHPAAAKVRQAVALLHH